VTPPPGVNSPADNVVGIAICRISPPLPDVVAALAKSIVREPARAAQYALNAGEHFVAEILLDRGHVIGEAAKYQAVQRGQAKFVRRMRLHAEGRRHAPFAADAILESDTGQIAFEVVCPGMIDVGEALDVVAILEGQ